MDDATRDYLREQVCVELGLPEAWGDRVRGNSIGDMRDDAARLARTLGLAVGEPESAHTRQRDEGGRFASNDMNRLIRGALYDGNIDVRAAPETEPVPVARLGAGVAGVTVKPPREDFNAQIRRASGRA